MDRDYRVPGGAYPPLNAVYYLYGVYLSTLQDLYKFPLIIDDVPHDNDARKMFLGGLVVQGPSLLLVGDMLYAGFGGICDSFNYTGSVVAVNLASRNVYRWATQAGLESRYIDDWTMKHGGGGGGIWQAGIGLASDGKDVFFTVGDGGGPLNASVYSSPVSGKTHLDVLSGSVVRVTLNEENGLGVQLVDWYRPYNSSGGSIGSGGFAILDEAFNTTNGKRIGVTTSKDSKLYIQDLENLGGYRQGLNGSDGILQTIHLEGQILGGIGSYPLEGGYIYTASEDASLSAYAFTAPSNGSQLFTLTGRSSLQKPLSKGVGIPTVTSNQGNPGSGIVWITDKEMGLLAYKAVPVNGSLVEIPLPKVDGAMEHSRPVFGDGRIYVVDSKGMLVALGAK
jgi:hypothetical protein